MTMDPHCQGELFRVVRVCEAGGEALQSNQFSSAQSITTDKTEHIFCISLQEVQIWETNGI